MRGESEVPRRRLPIAAKVDGILPDDHVLHVMQLECFAEHIRIEVCISPGIDQAAIGSVYKVTRIAVSDDVGTVYQSTGGGIDPSGGLHSWGERTFIPDVPEEARVVEVTISHPACERSFVAAVPTNGSRS